MPRKKIQPSTYHVLPTSLDITIRETHAKTTALFYKLHNTLIEVQELRKALSASEARTLAVLRFLLLSSDHRAEAEAIVRDFGFDKTSTVKEKPQ